MEDTYGCNLINTKRDGRQVTEFVGRYHVHILTEVSDLMHFENVSQFSRYVKKTLGKTPSDFRQK